MSVFYPESLSLYSMYTSTRGHPAPYSSVLGSYDCEAHQPLFEPCECLQPDLKPEPWRRNQWNYLDNSGALIHTPTEPYLPTMRYSEMQCYSDCNDFHHDFEFFERNQDEHFNLDEPCPETKQPDGWCYTLPDGLQPTLQHRTPTPSTEKPPLLDFNVDSPMTDDTTPFGRTLADIEDRCELMYQQLPPSRENDDISKFSRQITESPTPRTDDETADKPYARLIFEALMQSPGRRMMLKEIYQWFRENTTKPQESGSNGWQNSIRHNLSMNQAFENEKNEPCDGRKQRKANSEWLLTDEAIKNGVQSTTRYRKLGSAKKSSSNCIPAIQRQKSGARGGRAARRSAVRLRKQAERSKDAQRRPFPTSSPYQLNAKYASGSTPDPGPAYQPVNTGNLKQSEAHYEGLLPLSHAASPSVWSKEKQYGSFYEAEALQDYIYGRGNDCDFVDTS